MADPQVVGEDQDFLHVQTPSGQVVQVAKAGFDPSALSSQAPAMAGDPFGGREVPAPGPTPGPADLTQAQAGALPGTPGASPTPAPSGELKPGPMVASVGPMTGILHNQGPEQPGLPGVGPSTGAVNPGQLAVAPKQGGPDFLSQMPQSMDQISQGMQQEKSGVEALAKAGAHKAAQDAAALQGYQNQMKVFQAKAAQDAQAQEEALNKQMSVVTKAQDDVAKNAAVDPNHYWENKSTGGKISAAIGLILGGISGGLNHTGKNPVMDVIDKAIDRDIDAQKASINARQNNLSNQTNLLGQMRQNFSSMRDAQTAAQMVSYKNVEVQLQKIASQYQGQEVGARAQQALGELNQKQAQLGMQLRMSLAQQQALFGASGGSQGGGGIDNPNFLPKEYQSRAVKMPNGKFQVAATEEGAKKIGETIPAVNDMQDTINEMKKLKEEAGVGAIPYSTLAAKGAALKSRLAFQNQKVEGISRLSDTDLHLLEDQLANPTSFRSAKNEALLKSMEDHLASVRDNLYKQHIPGYQPVSFTPSK